MKSSISKKIFISFVVLSFFLLGMTTSSFYFSTLQRLEILMGQRAQSIAQTSVSLLDGDEHQKIMKSLHNFSDNPHIRSLSKKLKKIKDANQLKTDVYTVANASWAPGNMVFTATSSDKEFELKGQKIEEHILQSMNQGLSGYTPIFETVNGHWITGYAPLKTTSNSVTGVLEIALNVHEDVLLAKRELFQSLLGISLLSLILSLIISFFVSRRLTNPLIKLIDATKEIASGHFETKIRVKSRDEIGRLSRSFNHMVEQLGESRERERLASSMAIEAAETANTLKSQFLANMSHEIRTPLNSIIGNTSLMMNMEIDNDVFKFSNRIRKSGDALLALINDILDLSKIEAGELVLEEIDFDIYQMIDDVLDIFSENANKKKIHLYSFVDPQIPSQVYGDPYRLKQILINLIGNAIKFSDYNDVYLRVDRLDNKSGSIHLQFEVVDSGIGISKENIKNLFKPFNQVDASTNRIYGGTGLGLSICKNLVEKMDGEIWVESQENQGSHFFFKVSLNYNDQENRYSNHILNDKKIILISDKDHVSKFYQKTLVFYGAETFTVSNLDNAFNILNHYKIQAIIFDLSSFTQDISSLDSLKKDFSETNILAFTLEDESKIYGEDVSILSKPFHQDDVLDFLIHGSIQSKKNFQSSDRVVTGDAPLHILIVEDNQANQDVVTTMIESFQYTYKIANNGIEAISMTENESFDLILMDCQMPLMGGFEATIALRDKGFSMPIIAMTANAMKGDKEKCLDAGMNDYIPKPLKVNDLKPFLQKWSFKIDKKEKGGGDENPFIDEKRDVTDLEDDCIDKSSIDMLFMLNSPKKPDFAQQSIQGFLARSPDDVQSIRHAFLEKDIVRMKEEAHKFKTSVGIIGALKMISLCQDIESQSEDSELYENLIDQLDYELSRVKKSLEKFIV